MPRTTRPSGSIPPDPSKSTIIGTDKSTDGRGLVVYDLSGRELFYYPDGRMNNVDVRYNFPLGSSRVGLVGASNRARSLDFYKVNESDRSLTKVGSFAPTANIATPRGFSFYHSPDTGKYFAYVTDIGKVEQWELDGSTGSVTGRLVRSWTVSGPAHTEGLVADDEMKRLYIAQEDIGGIWRYGAEPGTRPPGRELSAPPRMAATSSRTSRASASTTAAGAPVTCWPRARARTDSTPTPATTTDRWEPSPSRPGTGSMLSPAWTG